jgi:hypothetical protein
MRRVFSCSIVTSLLLTLTAAAAEPADTGRVARLIADLGSEDYEVRQAATKELDALGVTALKKLKEAATSGDDEIRHRAHVLAHAISQRLETERLLTPSRVRLVCKDMSVADAVTELGKKTGFNIQLEGDKTKFASKRISLDTGDTNFWEALNQLCDQAGLTEKRADVQTDAMTRRQMMLHRRALIIRGNGMVAYGNQPGVNLPIQLKEGKSEPTASCQTNALRVRALPGAPRGGVSASEHEVNCMLEVTAEPKIQLLRILPPQVQSAEDENGLKVTYLPQPDETTANPYDAMAAMRGIGPAGNYGHQHPIRFRVRDGASKKISKLKGSVLIEMIAPPGPLVTVDDLLKAQGKSFSAEDGHSVKVTQVKQEGGHVKLRVVVESVLDGMNPWGGAGVVWVNAGQQQGQATNEAATGLHLEDADGKKIAASNATSMGTVFNGRTSTNDYELTYPVAKAQTLRLVLTGRRVAVLDVPFELKDVSLTK